MEYQKIANSKVPNQLSKFRTESWVEINDELRGGYTSGSHIKFKTAMLRSSIYDQADAYTLVKGKITITGAGDDASARRADKRNKGVYLKIVHHLLKA